MKKSKLTNARTRVSNGTGGFKGSVHWSVHNILVQHHLSGLNHTEFNIPSWHQTLLSHSAEMSEKMLINLLGFLFV